MVRGMTAAKEPTAKFAKFAKAVALIGTAPLLKIQNI